MQNEGTLEIVCIYVIPTVKMIIVSPLDLSKGRYCHHYASLVGAAQQVTVGDAGTGDKGTNEIFLLIDLGARNAFKISIRRSKH